MLNDFFKNGFSLLSLYITPLFNTLLRLGYFTSQWKEGYIVPLFKMGDPNLPENYRGITLLSTFEKLFTKVLNNRLNLWAENYSVYWEAQAGFRKTTGIVDNIFVFSNAIEYLLQQQKIIYICLLRGLY